MDESLKEGNVKKIYNSLKSQILSGQREAGSRLIETALARDFNASRLHVKSALRMLASEKLASHQQMKGFFVLPVGRELIEEIMEIRQALERVVVKKVINIATPENLEVLRKLMNRITVFVKNEMIEDGLAEVSQLYAYLYAICQYDRVVGILETYSDYISLIRHTSAQSLEQHLVYLENLSQLVTAIEKKDFNAATHQISLRHKYMINEYLE